jgi:hypothetical protein
MADITDYAMPMMRIEIFLRQMHNHLLDREMPQAQELSIQLVAEARVLQHTLNLMKEQEDALRQQTTPVQKRIPTTSGAGRATYTNGAAESEAGDGCQGR